MSIIDDLKSAYNNWWVFLILGGIFILFAFYLFQVPVEGFVALTIIFAFGMMIDGFGDAFFAIRNRGAMQGWGWQMAIGIISILIGLSLIVHPEVSVRVLPLYIGFWILLKGLLLAGIAFELKSHENASWRFVIVLAGLNALLGVSMILNPLFGASLIGTIAALGLLSIGISLVYVGFRVKKLGDDYKKIQQ